MRASILTAGLAAACALAACQQPPMPTASTPAPTATTASGASVPAPAASAAPLPGDHATTRRYRIAIDLPPLPADEAPLAKALRATADDAKREFLAALPDPAELPEFANRRFDLFLDFKVVARTSAFTSVRATGGMDIGGAHPVPVDASFVLDRKGGRLLTLDALFTDPDAARAALADFAHAALLKKLMANAPKPGEGSPQALREWHENTVRMLDDGTRPTSVNYAVFAVRAGADASAPSPGLTLIFPPYQVAAYVYGAQTVDVPAKVFAKFLRPAYAADFAGG